MHIIRQNRHIALFQQFIQKLSMGSYMPCFKNIRKPLSSRPVNPPKSTALSSQSAKNSGTTGPGNQVSSFLFNEVRSYLNGLSQAINNQHQKNKQLLDNIEKLTKNVQTLSDKNAELETQLMKRNKEMLKKQSDNPIEINLKVCCSGSYEEAKTLQELGLAFDRKGEHEIAIKYYQEALEIIEKMKGKGAYECAVTLNNLGSVYYSQKKDELAIKLFTEALEIYVKRKGKESLGHAIVLNNIGLAYKNIGELQQSLQAFEQAYAIRLLIFGEDHESTQLSKKNMERLRKRQ